MDNTSKDEQVDFDSDDIDFSEIDRDSDKPKGFDFSLSLLENPVIESETQKQPEHQQRVQESEKEIVDGSFMRDLGKMEKEISFDSVAYNIYESSELPECTGIIEGKQESTFTKTLNNMTKGASRILQPDFKHLILDFKEEKENESNYLKIKQNFQDYFGTQPLLTSKMHDHRGKLFSKHKRRSSGKSPIIAIRLTEKTKTSTLYSSNSSRSLHRFATEATKIRPKKNSQNNVQFQRTKIASHYGKNVGKQTQRTKSGIKSSSKKSSEKGNSKDKGLKGKKKTGKKKFDHNKEVYSEYYGLGTSPSTKNGNKKGSDSKSKQKQKIKKIVFSRKNVQIHH